jgi:hypothetical protein
MAAHVAPLESLLGNLITPEIIYFPIRHHSPACAWHLEQLIREKKPRAVLVEGPSSFNSLIPLILHEGTRAPVAIYTSFTGENVENPESQDTTMGRPRFAAYYPFCDYSPELVALRVGAETGASLRFIDLDFPEQIEAEETVSDEQNLPRIESLLEEQHFERSHFLQSLARQAGCRDHNDLWDHLFETRVTTKTIQEKDNEAASKNCEAFIRDVAAWCYFARLDAAPEKLQADGTTDREHAMAANIQEELAKRSETSSGPVLVVTGGFHTVALPELVQSPRQKNKPAKDRGALSCLVRYSFEQLDALNGYSAGMPSPFYYDQAWRAAKDRLNQTITGIEKRSSREKTATAELEPFTELAAKVLVQLGQLTRRKKLSTPLSVADEIAALEQARRLAGLRGHPGPTREDLLDGIRSCFVKGSMDAEGQVLLGLSHHILTGTAIGEVPSEAGTPPLVEDFRATAKRLRLSITDTMRHKNSLDLYRKRVHRKCSRFFHSLSFIEITFAVLARGPDFVKGTRLNLLYEQWNYQWSPQTESRLVEASIHGSTIEEAAANRLLGITAQLEKQGRGQSAIEAATMLVHACRMGLHRQTEPLRALIETQIENDPDFKSLAASLNQLIMLWESREPLEAHQLSEIPKLIRLAYERACYLFRNLENVPADQAHDALEALIVVRDVLQAKAVREESLDPALYFESLRELVEHSKTAALLAGGAAGLLHSSGSLDEGRLLVLFSGFLNSAALDAGSKITFLTGLLRTCRELAWRQPALTAEVEKLLTSWSEEEFIHRLPHLRLAFADFTPRETDHVAELVSSFHGGQKFSPFVHCDLSENEMLEALQLDAAVKKALAQDGLQNWIRPQESQFEPKDPE